MYRGYFINLDASTERRARMERQLRPLKLACERFAAVSGQAPAGRLSAGEVGCFASHLEVLRAAPRDGSFIHVLEDDAVLSPRLPEALNALLPAVGAYDLLFTSVLLPDEPSLLQMMRAAFASSVRPDGSFDMRPLDLAPVHFSGMSSYIVNPRALDKVTTGLARGYAGGRPIAPVDLFIRNEIARGGIRAACVLPFLSTTDLSLVSDINPGATRGLAIGLLSQSFYLDRDLTALQAQLDDIRGQPDAHTKFVGDILGYVVSDRFRRI